jgi:hypothetical protein
MRITVILEPDVAQCLKARMTERKLSLEQVVNEALRAGLARARSPRDVKSSVDPHSCQFRAGIDLDKLNQLVDELEAEATLATTQILPATRQPERGGSKA